MGTMTMVERVRWWVMLAEVTAATALALDVVPREELQTRVQAYKNVIGSLFSPLCISARHNFPARLARTHVERAMLTLIMFMLSYCQTRCFQALAR